MAANHAPPGEAFTVLAVDLPGVGGSVPSADGYAAADLARDVHQLIDELELSPAHLVGHDIGGSVAYAFAREFAGGTRTVTVLEVPVPVSSRNWLSRSTPPRGMSLST